MLLLLFTFARSESPLPKTKDGKENFDVEKQLCLRDVRISRVEGVSTAQFRLKGIKQDTLGQRAAAKGDGDWVIVAATGDKFDITMWLQLYFSFSKANAQVTSPFSSMRLTGRPHEFTRSL